jgi:hypothetical protein
MSSRVKRELQSNASEFRVKRPLSLFDFKPNLDMAQLLNIKFNENQFSAFRLVTSVQTYAMDTGADFPGDKAAGV